VAWLHELGAGEAFSVARGDGARLDGIPIDPPREEMPLEVVGLESSDPRWIVGAIEDLQGKTYRIRSIGSIAITLSYVATGRFDGMLSARGCRSVDAAAAQLVVREAGCEIAFVGYGLSDAALDLETRYPVIAARSGAHLEVVLEALEAGMARQAD
jgi:myo-inositol-1(or 4)-monophosphatase